MGERHPGPICGSRLGADWIDDNTMCRTRLTPPVPTGVHGGYLTAQSGPTPQCDTAAQYNLDPLFVATAKAMVEGARAGMDEYASEIFDIWFNGKAPAGGVTFDSEKWANYMRAEKRLQHQIRHHLTSFAQQEIREKWDYGLGSLQGSFRIRFHAEIGSEEGGYTTGYDVLHGSNEDVGDFLVTGRYAVTRPGASKSAYTITYEDLSFVFNDKVDANKKWRSDVLFEGPASRLARCLGTGPPKDYVLRIKWRAESSVKIEIPAPRLGELKQFPNRN